MMHQIFSSFKSRSCVVHASQGGQAGLTLLELLIAMSLGLLLLFGIGTIFVGSNQTYRVQEQNARIQESGRFALEILGRSIRQAGYFNLPFNNPVATATAFGGATINGNATSVTIQYDGTGNANCVGDTVAVNTVVSETYSLNGGNLQCNGNGNTQPLVSNVQDLQFLYGIDSNGDQSADQYTATPANWAQVVTARVCVLMRSQEPGIAIGNQSYLNCAGALGTATGAAATTTTPGDTRLYRAFVGTFNLRNRISQLP